MSLTGTHSTSEMAATALAHPAAAAARGEAAVETAPAAHRKRVKISRRDLINITSQMAIMTRSGVDVASALESLVRQSRAAGQKEMLAAIHQDVIGGKSFSAALREYQQVFGATYVASVTAGEASGCLPRVLAQLSTLQRSELRLRSTIRTLMAYPVLLMVVSSLVIVALVLFVLPQFAQVFADFDTPVPALTRWLLAVALELRVRYFVWGPVLTLLVAGLVALRVSPIGRLWWDRALLHVVLVRDVSRTLLIGRVCNLLGLMIDSGVPLLDALRLARSAVSNSLYRDLFSELEQNVLNGRGLGDTLLTCSFIPPSAAETLMTAERTGSLGNVTQLVGEHFEEEGETKLRELVAVLEPAITVGMGLIVAVVVLSVMLPMFDLATLAGGAN